MTLLIYFRQLNKNKKMQNKLDVAPPGDSTTIGPNIAYLHTIPAILKAVEFVSVKSS